MSRTKITVDTTNYTRSDAENVFSQYAQAESELKQLQIKKNLELSKIEEKYARTIEALESEMGSNFDKLQKFAEQNDTLFDKSRSLAFSYGTIGFRKGTPSLRLADKEITWDIVAARLKRMKAVEFVRTKIEVDKQALLKYRSDQKVSKLIQKAGMEVNTEETFFVKTNLEG